VSCVEIPKERGSMITGRRREPFGEGGGETDLNHRDLERSVGGRGKGLLVEETGFERERISRKKNPFQKALQRRLRAGQQP